MYPQGPRRRNVPPLLGGPAPFMSHPPQRGGGMATGSVTTGPAPQQPEPGGGGLSPLSMLGAARTMGGGPGAGKPLFGSNPLGLSDNFTSLSGFGEFLAGNGAGTASPMGASTLLSPHVGGLDAAYAANPAALAPLPVAAEPLAPLAEAAGTATAATDAGVAAAGAAPAMEAGAGAAAAEAGTAAAGAEAAPLLAGMGPWGWAALGGLGLVGAGSLLDWW